MIRTTNGLTSLDDFLAQEGILGEVTEAANLRAVGMSDVTECDRRAAGEIDPANRVDYKLGLLDDTPIIRILAANRLTAQAGLAEALERIANYHAEYDGDNYAGVACYYEQIARAALSQVKDER